MTLFVKYPSDRTAANIANVINRFMNVLGIHAEPSNASTVTLTLPDRYKGQKGEITRLIADIGDLPASVARKATITIDQGSGVIAMTEGVKMEPGSIAIAGLTVTVSSDITPVVREGTFEGETSFLDVPQLQVSQDQANFLTLPAGTDLRKVQETLNALKLSPTSIISVFNAMHQAGMIHAEIVVMPR
jgi:flagellar P-ring protein precursor FlgI